MSEDNILIPTKFTIKDCAKIVEPKTVSESGILKVPYTADNRNLMLTVTTDGSITVKMLGYDGHPDKSLSMSAGDNGVFRNFESAWYKHPDGCIHLEFAISGENTAKVTATEGD